MHSRRVFEQPYDHPTPTFSMISTHSSRVLGILFLIALDKRDGVTSQLLPGETIEGGVFPMCPIHVKWCFLRVWLSGSCSFTPVYNSQRHIALLSSLERSSFLVNCLPSNITSLHSFFIALCNPCRVPRTNQFVGCHAVLSLRTFLSYTFSCTLLLHAIHKSTM